MGEVRSPEFIYSIANDGVYVDLFAPSTIKVTTQAGTISLKMVTQFPYNQKVQLTVNVDQPLKSRIRIRVPSWAVREMSVIINGKKIVSGKPGTYVTLDRQWNNGDAISFTLPMNFRMTKYDGEERDLNHERYALEYGPLLMAYVSMKGQPGKIMLTISPDRLIKSLKAVDGKPLHFTVNENSDFEYMPYFEVQDEPFTCFP